MAPAKIGVLGAGTMGNGIAQVFATSGFDVELIDVRADLVERAIGLIGKSLDRVAKKQNWEPARAGAILAKIRGGTSLDAAKSCLFAVEAVLLTLVTLTNVI